MINFRIYLFLIIMQASPVSSKQSQSDHLHQQAFNHSLGANIIFLVSDGRIIKANMAACKLLGYSRRELLTKNRKDIFKISESNYKKMFRTRKEEGSAKADLSMVRKSGRLLPCEVTTVVFRDDEGVMHSILSIADLRERISKQQSTDRERVSIQKNTDRENERKSDIRHAEDEERIESIHKTTYDIIWEWDIPGGTISFGSNYEQVFGYKLPRKKLALTEWLDLFRPAEREMLEKLFLSFPESVTSGREDSFPFNHPDGTKGRVKIRATHVKDQNEQVMRVIGVIHDLSRLQKLEGILEQEIIIKEQQIVEAIVEAKEMERSDLGKELHDNINQLLGASMLYLDMARKDLKNGDIYLLHSSEYTFTAIEEIRKLTRGLVTETLKDFGSSEAIQQMARDTMESTPLKIGIQVDKGAEEAMSEKFQLNAYRILQEQLNNIIKHAKATKVAIRVGLEKGQIRLSITDDGIGFDLQKKGKGIGIQNIINRAGLYKGDAQFITAAGKGCSLTVDFPAQLQPAIA